MKRIISPKNTSSLATWLFYLENIHNKTIDMGLSRVKRVAEIMNILKPAPFIFTVSGTNGKGTTCRILEMILIAAGYRVGVYSSPHLMRYTERVRIQNTELKEEAHTASFAEIEAARGNISLTYFEYGTLAALLLFMQAQLNVVILEVGLGGRLDATNIVDSDVSVVTSIALDHTNLLGSNRESIGREKAGIFRTGKPAVIGELDVPYTIIEAAKEKNALLLRLGVNWRYIVLNNSWNFIDSYGRLYNLPLPKIPQSNAATALAALRASGLNINEQAIREGISNASLPGRFQIISKYPRVILDVAHNPYAAAYIAQKLTLLPSKGKILVVIGMLRDKDIGSTIDCMRKIVDYWYCASIKHPRGASASQLMQHTCYGKAYDNVQQAWFAAIKDAKLEDTILVCGSFHTVAQVMNIIECN